MSGLPLGAIIVVGLLLAWIGMSVRIIQEYERGVVFLLGKYAGLKGPGLNLILVPFYRMVVIDTRVITRDVPSQDVITRDNVSVKVNAVIYFRVVHPDKAVLAVENYLYATSQLAQTTLRSVLGEHQLDDLLSQRDKINSQLQQILDVQTEPWGIKISNVEVKHVDLPPDMQRIMAREAEAERERRAKVIAAEGEYQSAQKLADAAEILATQPATLQLRYLQTLVEIAAENNSTTIFPIPMEFMKAFMVYDDNKK